MHKSIALILALALLTCQPQFAAAQRHEKALIEAAAQSGPAYVYIVELDIAPAQFDRFMAEAKTNAAASMQDPGCREFAIVVSKQDPHRVLFFEVYDNEAALKAHEATGHFKQYQAATKDMVEKRETKAFFSVAAYSNER